MKEACKKTIMTNSDNNKQKKTVRGEIESRKQVI